MVFFTGRNAQENSECPKNEFRKFAPKFFNTKFHLGTRFNRSIGSSYRDSTVILLRALDPYL